MGGDLELFGGRLDDGGHLADVLLGGLKHPCMALWCLGRGIQSGLIAGPGIFHRVELGVSVSGDRVGLFDRRGDGLMGFT